MFRSILVKQNLRNLNKQLNLRKCSSNKLNDLINENLNVNKKDQINKSTLSSINHNEELIKLNENHNNQFNILNETNSIKIDDPILNSINECNNIPNLLETIGPEIKKLNVDQLTKVYQKIILLWFSASKENSNVDHEELNKFILMSISFKLLIEQTEKLIDKLDIKCLIKSFQVFSLINLNPSTRIIELILIRLNERINELSIKQISDCLMAFNFYLNDHNNYKTKLFKFSNYSRIKDNFLENLSNKILRYEFNLKEINLIFNLIKSYSKDNFNRSFKMITNLIEKLDYLIINYKFEFNLNQAIILLNLLKETKFVNVLSNENQLPLIYYDLINYLNQIIYSQLKLNKDDHNLYNYYLLKLHRNEDSQLFNLKSIYDPKILELISNYLLNNLDKQNQFFIFNLIYNYSRFDIYDERLLKLIYDQILINDQLRNRLNLFQVYFLFSKYRLPFVDYNRLAIILFNLDNLKFRKIINNNQNNFIIFRDLILTDINNNKLYEKLIDLIDNQDNIIKQYDKILNRTLQDILLAKYYFKLFNKIDDEKLRLIISNKLDNLINDYFKLNDKPKIYNNYLQKSNKLQRGVFLSNDLYLRNVIAIYDKSKKDLISLSNYIDYFNEIDCILPLLNNDQELIIFIESRFLDGNIGNYERNYNYCLKKVLNHYGFKLIDVYPDEFAFSTLTERVNFFIQKAKNNYK